MKKPLFGASFSLPPAAILMRGSSPSRSLFRIGWPLAGLCPGPAIASLSVDFWRPAVFVAAMLVRMGVHAGASRRFLDDDELQVQPKDKTIELTQLSAQLSVRPQLLPEEVAQLAEEGFKGSINNRPT